MTQANFSHCGTQWPVGTQYCGKCRAALPSTTVPVANVVPTSVAEDGLRWARTSGLFAQRIEVADVKSLFTKYLSVEEGTRGLLMQHGRFVGELDPGRHTLQTVTERLKSVVFGAAVSAIVLDVSSQRLDVNCSGLRTSDNVETNVVATLTLAMNNPRAFFINVMKGASRVTADEVIRLVQPTVLTVMSSVIRSATVEELGHDELVERLRDELNEKLSAQLNEQGLIFIRLDHASFTCPSRDALVRESARLDDESARQQLRDRQRQIQQRLDQESTQDELARIRSQQDFNTTVGNLVWKSDEDRHQRQFQSKLLALGRDRDWEIAYDQFLSLKDDLAAQRAYVKSWTARQHQLQLDRLEHQITRQKLEDRYELDAITLTVRRQQEQDEYDAKVEREDAAFQTEIDRTITRAKTKAETDRIEAETAAEKLKGIRNIQFENLKGLLEIDRIAKQQELEAKEAAQKIEDDRGDREAKRKQEEEAAAHARKMDDMRTRNELRPDVLVAVSDPEQAKLLASQLQLATLQGFSPDQLALIKAAESPAVAQALIAKYQAEAAGHANSNAEIKALYERQSALQAANSDQLVALAQQNMAAVLQVNAMSLQTQRDTAVAAVSGHVPMPRSPAPAPSSPSPNKDPIGFKTSPPQATRCPKCDQTSDVSSTFCGRCGSVLKASL